MLRLLAALFVLVATVLSCSDDDVIDALWDDVDIDPVDWKITKEEILLFFGQMSDPTVGVVMSGAFVDFWQRHYCNETDVPNYFFDQWDQGSKGYLTADDLDVVYDHIDTNHIDSIGYLDFFWEWHPYFKNLYSMVPTPAIVLG